MKKMSVTDFAKELRKIRVDNNEVLIDMAERLGVSISYLSAIENGKRNISKKMFKRLIKEYNLSEEEYARLFELSIKNNKNLNLNLKKLNSQQIDTVILFAMTFQNLNEEEMEELQTLLKGKII